MAVRTNEPRENIARISEEASLIRRVRRGDRNAFRPLVERYQGRVYALLLRAVGDAHEAEDLCQEVFVRAYRALGGFDTRYPFENWLLRIATNLARTALKRRRFSLQLLQDGAHLRAGPSEAEHEKRVEELRRSIDQALSGLSRKKRMALLLFHQAKRSYADIAEIMDMPIGTVKTVIHRARNEIRRRLAEKGLL